jgi:hypothetical protein
MTLVRARQVSAVISDRPALNREPRMSVDELLPARRLSRSCYSGSAPSVYTAVSMGEGRNPALLNHCA